ncbi:MAG: hypothetical protein RLZZ519_3041 [Bacteroidota bacterium]|jgi:hypothetical protein
MKSKLTSASTLFFLLVLAFGCTPADVKWIGKPAPDERAKMGLKGPVKKVTTSYYRAEDTTMTLDSLLKTEPSSVYQDIFTATGQQLEVKDWSRGTLNMHQVHHLNDQEQTIEIEYKRETGARINHASMAYFPNGLLRQEQYFDENGNMYRQETYSYDDLNRLSEIETKNFEGGANERPIIELMKMEYEDTSTLLKRRTKTREKQTVFVQDYEKGVVHTTTMYPKGEITKFKHDAAGNGIQTEDFDKYGKRTSAFFADFDAMGNRVRIRHYGPENTLELWQTWRYDSLGNQIEERSAYAYSAVPHPQDADTLHPDIMTMEYQFDSHGNILQKVETENGHLRSIWIFELEYDPETTKKPAP